MTTTTTTTTIKVDNEQQWSILASPTDALLMNKWPVVVRCAATVFHHLSAAPMLHRIVLLSRKLLQQQQQQPTGTRKTERRRIASAQPQLYSDNHCDRRRTNKWKWEYEISAGAHPVGTDGRLVQQSELLMDEMTDRASSHRRTDRRRTGMDYLLLVVAFVIVSSSHTQNSRPFVAAVLISK